MCLEFIVVSCFKEYFSNKYYLNFIYYNYSNFVKNIYKSLKAMSTSV